MEDLIGKHVHFVGIGGVGMSAIAQVLIEKGVKVSGSDQKENIYTIRLKDQGAKIFLDHQAKNIRGVDLVVYSSAIRPDNPEMLKAKANQVPIQPRAQMLGRILESHACAIGITGTHGKTTTSAMISYILLHAGLQPTFMVGGELCDIGNNAGLGQNQFAVAEADESDGSFTQLHPQVAVITNIEMEHCDFYPSMEDVYKSYAKYIEGMKPGGRLVLQGDHPHTEAFLKRLPNQKIETFGLDSQKCILWAKNIHYTKGQLRFSVYEYDRCLGEIGLKVIGKHNVLNALAAIQVALRTGVNFDKAAAALAQFTGTKKRFQVVGTANDIMVVEDYAHHPTEVYTTLEGALQAHGRRIVCVFQPHRFSRVQALKDQFKDCFALADEVVITSVYSAGEDPIDGINGELLTAAVAATGKTAHFFARKDEIPKFLIEQVLRPGDLLVVMGAGDIHSVGKETLHRLHQNEVQTNLVLPSAAIIQVAAA